MVVTRWRIGKGLIDDVPGVAAVAEVLDQLGDVVDEDLGQGFVRPWGGWVGDKVGELGLPDEVVAADLLAVGLRDVEEVVSAGEVEGVLLRLGKFEL